MKNTMIGLLIAFTTLAACGDKSEEDTSATEEVTEETTEEDTSSEEVEDTGAEESEDTGTEETSEETEGQ